MDNSLVTIVMAVLVVAVCSVYSEESVHESAIQSADFIDNHGAHHAQKRMAPSNLAEDEDRLLLREEALEDLPVQENYMDKRGSLFRFGKRGGLFRFGKRQGGTLFRFGKRGGGALFRFGRSGPADFEYAKESDLDLLRNILAQSEYYNQDGAASKRGIDSFHWGSDSDK